MKPRPIVDQPGSRGYALVEARIFDGEKDRSVPVCVDTGADASCVDDRLVKLLRLPTEPTKLSTCSGVSGRTASSSCTKFTMYIGDVPIEMHAMVLPALGAGLLVGMNTLQAYGIDVLNSQRVLQIGRAAEVPLMYRREMHMQRPTCETRLLARFLSARISVKVSTLLLLGIAFSPFFIAY